MAYEKIRGIGGEVTMLPLLSTWYGAILVSLVLRCLTPFRQRFTSQPLFISYSPAPDHVDTHTSIEFSLYFTIFKPLLFKGHMGVAGLLR